MTLAKLIEMLSEKLNADPSKMNGEIVILDSAGETLIISSVDDWDDENSCFFLLCE